MRRTGVIRRDRKDRGYKEAEEGGGGNGGREEEAMGGGTERVTKK